MVPFDNSLRPNHLAHTLWPVAASTSTGQLVRAQPTLCTSSPAATRRRFNRRRTPACLYTSEITVSDDRDDQTDRGDTSRGPIRRASQLARRGVSSVLKNGVDRLKGRVRGELIGVLSSRRRVETLQSSLATVANWSIQRGFDADPNAELLFEFVDWLEDRHGRRRVSTILLRSPMLRDPEFLDALAHLSEAFQPGATVSDDRRLSQRRLEAFKRRAGDRLLEVLVELAALETDSPPPSGSAQKRICYFEDAPLPPRFEPLAVMTRGERLAERQMPHRKLQQLKGIWNRLRPTQSSNSALAKYIPGLDDEQLHFLVFSTTFFLHSYLVRNLIEALPDYADELVDALDEDSRP